MAALHHELADDRAARDLPRDEEPTAGLGVRQQQQLLLLVLGIVIVGLILGTVVGVAGIYVAYLVWGKPLTEGKAATVHSSKWQAKFAPLHKLFLNKWYFDELIDYAIVRPVRWFGRFAHDTFERLVVGATTLRLQPSEGRAPYFYVTHPTEFMPIAAPRKAKRATTPRVSAPRGERPPTPVAERDYGVCDECFMVRTAAGSCGCV